MKRTLESLFLPIAPTVRLFEGRPRSPGAAERPPGRIRGRFVAWQHLGVSGLGGSTPGIYRSARLNRRNRVRDEARRWHRIKLPLFRTAPAFGEATLKPLGAGLWCRVPLVLCDVRGRTWGPRSPYSLVALRRTLHRLAASRMMASQPAVRAGGIVIAWNVFQHFYPYFDTIRVDWLAELTRWVRQALRNRTPEAFASTLRMMSERLQDGHAFVHRPTRDRSATLPLAFDWIEGRLVVTWAGDALPVRAGDVVLRIHGRPAAAVLRDEETEISGSPQWKRWKALRWSWNWGVAGSRVRLRIRRGARTFHVTLTRSERRTPEEPRTYRPVDWLGRDVWYLDVTRAKWEHIQRVIRPLSRARAVVIDLRGYPSGWEISSKLLPHLLDMRRTNRAWMQVARRLYPDRERLVGYDRAGWPFPPARPRFCGRLILLTDAGAISNAECIVGFFKPYRLGTVIGQPTAGANGNVTTFTLPGGYTIGWTGMRVVKHDGSRFHVLGFRPDISVRRTLRGVREGRDEFVERALRVLNRP